MYLDRGRILFLDNQFWIDAVEATLSVVDALVNKLTLTFLEFLQASCFAFFEIISIYFIAEVTQNIHTNDDETNEPDDTFDE